MYLKQIIDESFGDYKECSMLLVTPSCKWKCEGCQNKHLDLLPTKNFPNGLIWKRFLKNPLSSAIVIGGLEPFDDVIDICQFIVVGSSVFSMKAPLIIYTGYTPDELDWEKLQGAFSFYQGPIYVKYGRYISGREKVYSDDLGVWLASNNQFVVQY